MGKEPQLVLNFLLNDLVDCIYLLPIGNIAKEMLCFLPKKIEMRFDYSSEILEKIGIPERAFDLKRNQYSSTQILRNILEFTPENALKIIGLISVDLYIPVLTFVFGQAQLNGKAAVVSIHRLRQEYYGLPPNNRILLKRLGKEVIHELGHTFGMVHCWDTRCVMHFSNSIREIDVKEDKFCESCSKILSSKL